MRLVGGNLRGRTLTTPSANTTRPTTDRARESLFNVLVHNDYIDLEDARVLDLFAGSGALGLEAVSHGAAFCLFVEQAASARGAIRTNIEHLGLQGCTKIFRRDATKLGDVGTMAPFDLLFADPPYGKGAGERALKAAVAGGWLRPGALCIIEENNEVEFDPPEAFATIRQIDIGNTQLIMLKAPF